MEFLHNILISKVLVSVSLSMTDARFLNIFFIYFKICFVEKNFLIKMSHFILLSATRIT